jgi:RNA polymerase sigma-70 factor (ECF subfamily)
MSFSWHEIRNHLTRDSSTLGFQHDFHAIRHDHPALSRFHDPAGLLDALHHGMASADEKNQLLEALIEAAQADGTAADCALTLMLLALWPGLDAVYRRSRWRGAGSSDELSSEVLTRATEAVRCIDLRRVHRYAATILRNVERDLLRARQREVCAQSLNVEIDPDEVAAEPVASEPGASPEWLHREMLRIVGADAALVISVAVDGATQAEAASELGLTAAAARKRYQRALRRARERLSEAA